MTTRRSFSRAAGGNVEFTRMSATTSSITSKASLGMAAKKSMPSQPVVALIQPPRSVSGASIERLSGCVGVPWKNMCSMKCAAPTVAGVLVARAAADEHAERRDLGLGPLARDDLHAVG